MMHDPVDPPKMEDQTVLHFGWYKGLTFEEVYNMDMEFCIDYALSEHYSPATENAKLFRLWVAKQNGFTPILELWEDEPKADVLTILDLDPSLQDIYTKRHPDATFSMVTSSGVIRHCRQFSNKGLDTLFKSSSPN